MLSERARRGQQLAAAAGTPARARTATSIHRMPHHERTVARRSRSFSHAHHQAGPIARGIWHGEIRTPTQDTTISERTAAPGRLALRPLQRRMRESWRASSSLLSRTRSTRAARRLLSRHLHRQSVGAPTSRAFPRTASAFAIAAREQRSRAVTPADGFAPRTKETHQVNRVPLTDRLTAHPQLALSHRCERPLRLLAGFRHGRAASASADDPLAIASARRRWRHPRQR